jgi:hypothetical protein
LDEQKAQEGAGVGDVHEGQVGAGGEELLNCSTENLECSQQVLRRKREQRRGVEEGEQDLDE